MARVGSWDIDGDATTWFDVTADVSGWVDRDYIPFEVSSPTPPPPPGPHPTGGWQPKQDECTVPFYLPDTKEWVEVPCEIVGLLEAGGPLYSAIFTNLGVPGQRPLEADYGVVPVGADRVVRALASGTASAQATEQGPAVLLEGDDGTRLIYLGVEGPAQPRKVVRGDILGKVVAQRATMAQLAAGLPPAGGPMPEPPKAEAPALPAPKGGDELWWASVGAVTALAMRSILRRRRR